ncbi:hypothetical protein, partial [Klebsiella pneumoniae]|uniref:hypothetical protein n=2 Tax=Klebsiella pneumoniae TaxID=573 RepID=UPI001F20F6E5
PRNPTPRPGKRSAAGEDTSGAIPAFVPDGATLIRPTASSRKLLYPRPGKRSAAGEDTADTVAIFVPDGGTNALSGLRHPPVSSYTVGPASAAPPGDDHRHGAAFMPGGGSRLARHTVRATCR